MSDWDHEKWRNFFTKFCNFTDAKSKSCAVLFVREKMKPSYLGHLDQMTMKEFSYLATSLGCDTMEEKAELS
uniref:Uncharacterized protein n=1 Tax=Ditylenchus dipsaci TaxID=166011 RepID=A0A915DED3_9BILA